MEEVHGFITKFHALEGVTLAEKKRNFFHLLHEYSSLPHNDSLLNAIASQLTPQTHLEKLFMVDFLIYFRRTEKLLEEFIKGDEIVISKVAKQKWFFAEFFKELGPECVDQLLPTLSYSLRLKVLKKMVLILSEEQSDQIFDSVVKRYGTYVASNILTSCSSKKVEEVLRNQPIKLWTSQLKLLYNKNPDLMYIYFEERVHHEGNSDFLNNNPIIQFVAMKNPTMFCDLQEKYKFQYCRIGKRSTKKIVRLKKDNIIANPELYGNNLHSGRLVRNLGQAFNEVYFKLFPREIDRVFSHYNNAYKLLRFYPKRQQFTLFKNTFEQVFSDSLDVTYKSMNNVSLLEMIYDNDEREEWARLKAESNCLKYFTANNCIKTLKEKLDPFNQISKRSDYIATVTECCLINRDWQALLTVCELLCIQLKNDDKLVHTTFLQIIANEKYKHIHKNLGPDHWNYIKQIIVQSGDLNNCRMVFKYLEFAFTNGNFSEAEFINMLKHRRWIDHLSELKFLSFNFQEKVLLNLIKLAPQIIQETDTIENSDIQIVLACKRFNSLHYDKKVSIFNYPRLLVSIKNALKCEKKIENHSVASAVEWLICTKDRNEETEDLTKLYWDNLHRLATTKAIIWFLRFRPDIVLRNIEKFLEVTVSGSFCYEYFCVVRNLPLWRIVKCYSHLEIDKKLIEYCKHKLSDVTFDSKHDLAEPLSIMMPTLEFAKLVETYKPSIPTVNQLDEEAKKQFLIRRYLLKSFVNSKDVESINVILHFLIGDYFSSCLSSLYSCLYKIPENRIMPILNTLCNTGAVSVKKHGFYFICITQDEPTILNSLKSCCLTQSIAMTYQHFTKNASPLSWTLLEDKLDKLDNNDHFTCLLLVNKPAPRKYKSQYFERAFEVFQNKRNRFTQVLVDKLKEETIGQLNSRFFVTMRDYFLIMKKSDLIFAYYLFYCQEGERFNIVFDALRRFKENQWSFRDNKGREKLNQFVVTLSAVYFNNNITDDILTINTFREGFIEIFTPPEAFEEYIILCLMQFKNQSIPNLAESVVTLHNQILNIYGKLTIFVFADALKKILNKFCPDEASKFKLYCSLFDSKKEIEDVVLITYMLPQKRPQHKESNKFHNSILGLLKRIENDTVQVHLHQNVKE